MLIVGSIFFSLALIGKSPQWNMSKHGNDICALIIIYLLTGFMTYGLFQSFHIPPEYEHLHIPPDLLPTIMFPLMVWCWYMTVFFTVFYFKSDDDA